VPTQLYPSPFPYTTLFRSVSGSKGPDQIVDVLEADERDAGHLGRRARRPVYPAEAEPCGLHQPALEAAGRADLAAEPELADEDEDRKSTRLNSSHVKISYA